jgi:hypothetical protein
MISEQRVHVDGTPKALRVAEVWLVRHFQLESGGGMGKGERGVQLQRNEGAHHPLGKAESTEV